MGAACGMTVFTARLDLLIALRIVQGFSGGILLVAGSDIRIAIHSHLQPGLAGSRRSVDHVPTSRMPPEKPCTMRSAMSRSSGP